ncbi:hypothetical protein PPL_05015 [Heterostelium album PN500]|uniref:BP74 N-terminal domain-containing protein n=1 Tax=Heterostelium pallidum (strain ATCC 26659 / Pp 5 / PN500) TaxID=670386 RepID=D3B971_HETP5|nr:hypothetical protein PPL_05015 [Heterostelium album PN500]EFA82110.1 hypothetical protein PPL_05015 [Heterostelium album PN500]|eukprot:XP_020434227.1 hypothetical protein PPL_05015 [Heterostelium album PN500]
MKSVQILSIMLLAMLAVASASGSAYFLFTDEHDEFVIKLSDPVRIAEARDIIATGSTKGVMGIIVKQRVWYNFEWKYYLDPSTITFFDFAIEVCDASIAYTEEHLAEVGGALLPGNRWCPWHSRLVREL